MRAVSSGRGAEEEEDNRRIGAKLTGCLVLANQWVRSPEARWGWACPGELTGRFRVR